MGDVNYTFLLSLSIIALGYFLKRRKVITIDDGRFMARLIFNLTLPAVIMNTIPYVDLNVLYDNHAHYRNYLLFDCINHLLFSLQTSPE